MSALITDLSNDGLAIGRNKCTGDVADSCLVVLPWPLGEADLLITSFNIL